MFIEILSSFQYYVNFSHQNCVTVQNTNMATNFTFEKIQQIV